MSIPTPANKRTGHLSFCLVIFSVLTLIILLYCSCAALLVSAGMDYTMAEITKFSSDSVALNVLCLLLAGLALWLADHLLQKITPARLFLIFAVALGIFMIYLIGSINLMPTWDASKVYQAAVSFRQKDYSAAYPGGYLAQFPYQIPLVLYDELVIATCGDNYIAPQLINVAFLIGTYYFLYRITDQLSCHDCRADRLCILGTTLFFPFSMYALFVYGNVPSAFFMCAGVFFCLRWLSSGRKKDLAVSLLTAGTACLFKGTSYIALAAICAAVIWQSRKQKAVLPLLAMCCGIALTALTPILMKNAVAKKDTKISLSGNLYVEYALEMGSVRSDRGAGWFDSSIQTLLSQTDAAQQKTVAWTVIRTNYQQLFRSPSICLSFYRDKWNSLWTNPEFQGFWTIQANKLDEAGTLDTARQSFLWIDGADAALPYDAFTESFMNGSLNRAIRSWQNTFQNLTYLASAVYLVSRWRKKDFTAANCLGLTVFAFGFVFLTFWEAKAQYSVLYFLFLIPYGAVQLSQIFLAVERKLRHQ